MQQIIPVMGYHQGQKFVLDRRTDHDQTIFAMGRSQPPPDTVHEIRIHSVLGVFVVRYTRYPFLAGNPPGVPLLAIALIILAPGD